MSGLRPALRRGVDCIHGRMSLVARQADTVSISEAIRPELTTECPGIAFSDGETSIEAVALGSWFARRCACV